MFIAKYGNQPLSEIRGVRKALSRVERLVVSDILLEMLDAEYAPRTDTPTGEW